MVLPLQHRTALQVHADLHRGTTGLVESLGTTGGRGGVDRSEAGAGGGTNQEGPETCSGCSRRGVALRMCCFGVFFGCWRLGKKLQLSACTRETGSAVVARIDGSMSFFFQDA